MARPLSYVLYVALLLIAIHTSPSSQRAVPNQPPPPTLLNTPLNRFRASSPAQQPLIPFALPPVHQIAIMATSSAAGTSEGGGDAGVVLLSDVLARDKSMNLFAAWVREVAEALGRLDSDAQNTTVLAPSNRAVEAMARKPWERAGDYGALGASAYEGDDGRARASGNMRRFVEAHLVPRSPWGEGKRVRTVGAADGKGGGDEVWWEERGGKRFVQPDNIEVISIASTVANGELWIIDGTRHISSGNGEQ